MRVTLEITNLYLAYTSFLTRRQAPLTNLYLACTSFLTRHQAPLTWYQSYTQSWVQQCISFSCQENMGDGDAITQCMRMLG